MQSPNYQERIEEITAAVEAHDETAARSLSLIASGNVVSPRVWELMETDLLYRAAEGKREHGNVVFPGLENFYDIEQRAEADIADIFGGEFADLRPISGSQANFIVYTACTDVGDTVLVPSISSGSHVSQAGGTVQQLRDYEFVHPTLQDGTFMVDPDDVIDKIHTHDPSLVVLGGSVMTEYQDVNRIVDHAHAHDCTVLYDIAHPAGLIATGSFPNPMAQGVDLMTLTTCKTIPGPSHAWIIGRESYREAIQQTVFPGFVSGGHLQEYVGSVVGLYEILAAERNYGDVVIDYANELGELLDEGGFDIVRTTDGAITETHQIVARGHDRLDSRTVVDELERINILVNRNILPEGFESTAGLRLGTQEVTRLGADREVIRELGKLIPEFLDESDPDYDEYRRRVERIRADMEMQFW